MRLFVLPFLVWLAAGLTGRAAGDPAHNFAPGPAGTAAESPAGRWIDAALALCDAVEKGLPEYTRVAEVVATRHIAGGLIGLHHNYQSLGGEFMGRSGNMVHIGFERPWKTDRTSEEKTQDMAVFGWDRAPYPFEKDRLVALKKQGVYLIGFGPKELPELAELSPLCDVYFPTGLGADDRLIELGAGGRAGNGTSLANQIHGWVFMAEVVGALTRHGKMPTIFKAYLYDDGRAWGDKYLGKVQFHDEFQVPPLAAGKLARQYLDQVRRHLRLLQRREINHLRQAADLIAAESRNGRKTVVLTEGHSPWTYVGKGDDAAWATGVDLHAELDSQFATYEKEVPRGALLLRLGYYGLHHKLRAAIDERNQRVILIASLDDSRPGYQNRSNVGINIDLGCAFGDAVLSVPGYPIKLFPVSGIMQAAAYEAVNVEVLDRLKAHGAR